MERVLGIDVSHWQDNISTPQRVDFAKAKAQGAQFVFIKASQATFRDRDIEINWQNAREAGLLRGAYHFLVWEVAPETQADFFCSVIGDDPGELPPVADFEWWKTTPPNALNILERFLNRVEANLGRIPMIYTAPGFWNPHGSKDAKWARYPLWIAHYGVYAPIVPKPWPTWNFWQYTSKGDGIAFGAESKDLDMNWFNGSLDDLYRFAGVEKPHPSEVSLEEWSLEVDAWARGMGYNGPKPKKG